MVLNCSTAPVVAIGINVERAMSMVGFKQDDAGHALAPHLVLPLAMGGHGPVVAVKDVIDIAGTPTQAGSRAFADAPAAVVHAEIVSALLAAGCRIVGKTTMHEIAFGVTGFNPFAGTPPNPQFPDYVPGGSSSGSATIVAAGLVDFAIGTDTGGSIRVPAACCGVVGLKPSFGRLSRRGLVPMESSLDCVGPLASDVAGVIQAMTIMEPGFAVPILDRKPKFALIQTEADAVIGAAVARAVAGGSFEVVDGELPGLITAFQAGMIIMNAEMARAFGHLVAGGQLGADVARRLEASARITDAQVADAEITRQAFATEVDRLLDRVDAIVLPTMPAAPVRLSEAADAAAALAMTRLVRPFNLTGHPAISLPVTAAPFPISLQLIGRRGDDARLCALALRLETEIKTRTTSGH
jgi:amidase